MAYFFCSFRIALLRRLRSRSSVVFLILAAALTLGIVLGSGARQQAVVQVGLVLPEEGEALEALLLERSSELVRFVPTDEATLDRKVLTGQWDCGLVASEDFAEKLEKLDTRNLFTLKTGPGSTVYPLVQETVAACVMELTAPVIAREYLYEKGMDTQLREQSANRVDILLETLDGEAVSPLELTASTGRRILRGLAALLALVWGVFLTVDLGKWLESEAAARLRSVRSVTALLLPQLSAALLPVLVWGLAALPMLGGGWSAAAAFPAFLAVLLGIGLVVSRFRLLWQSAMGAVPFLVVGSLLLEGVLLDVSVLFPELARWTGWLPVSLYVKGSDGSAAAIAALLLEAAGLLTLSLLLDRGNRRGRGSPVCRQTRF